MNVLLDLTETQIADIEVVLGKIRQRHQALCDEFARTVAQRAERGESPQALNAESAELARWKSALSRVNLLRIAVDEILAKDPSSILTMIQKSKRTRFSGRPPKIQASIPEPIQPTLAAPPMKALKKLK